VQRAFADLAHPGDHALPRGLRLCAIRVRGGLFHDRTSVASIAPSCAEVTVPDLQIRPGLSLNYRLSGPEGAPVLTLITGLGGLQEGWFRQVPHFEQQWRVLTFDNRGAGRSGVLDVPTTIHDMAEDVVLLLDALQIRETHVFGVSMGGKIAQELALQHPERVISLILGCTTAGDATRVEGEASGLRGAATATEAEWTERLIPLLFGKAYRERNAGSMKAFARSRARNPQNPVGFARQWEAYRSFDSWDRLPELRHRTLVITGDEDTATHPDNSRQLAERIPGARLALIRGAGHSFHIEEADETNRVVESFLKEAP
jgi:pimeloyl-ACP methyl ester carboxylesterase